MSLATRSGIVARRLPALLVTPVLAGLAALPRQPRLTVLSWRPVSSRLTGQPALSILPRLPLFARLSILPALASLPGPRIAGGLRGLPVLSILPILPILAVLPGATIWVAVLPGVPVLA